MKLSLLSSVELQPYPIRIQSSRIGQKGGLYTLPLIEQPVDRVGHRPRVAVLEPVGDPVPRQHQEDERPHDRHGPVR